MGSSTRTFTVLGSVVLALITLVGLGQSLLLLVSGHAFRGAASSQSLNGF